MSTHTLTHTNLLPNPSALQGKSIDQFANLLTPQYLLVFCTESTSRSVYSFSVPHNHSSLTLTHWFVLDLLGVVCMYLRMCACACVDSEWFPSQEHGYHRYSSIPPPPPPPPAPRQVRTKYLQLMYVVLMLRTCAKSNSIKRLRLYPTSLPTISYPCPKH